VWKRRAWQRRHGRRKSILKIIRPVHALRYRWAEQRDEKKGYPLTAATEWREAADLFAHITPLAERCWREWERIMHLPRRLAEPIG